MCALKHAFFSTNLLSLACKIVEDVEEDIPDRYSKNLNTLVHALLTKGFFLKFLSIYSSHE